jgi:hypothetical protein
MGEGVEVARAADDQTVGSFEEDALEVAGDGLVVVRRLPVLAAAGATGGLSHSHDTEEVDISALRARRRRIMPRLRAKPMEERS